MIIGQPGMVPGGEGGGRRTPAQPFHAVCDILPVGTDDRQVETVIATSAGSRPTSAQCRCKMSILRVRVLAEGRLQASACSATILSVRRSPEPPTMIGTGPMGRG